MADVDVVKLTVTETSTIEVPAAEYAEAKTSGKGELPWLLAPLMMDAMQQVEVREPDGTTYDLFPELAD